VAEGLARTVRWSGWSGAESGLEHLELVPERHGLRASGVVIGQTDRGRFGLSYRLLIDAEWRLREAALATTAGLELMLTSDGSGRWADGNGQALPEIDGCVDLDIEATPFTNTLPIRRLGLTEGGRAEISVAYVSVPELDLSIARQRYSRLHGAHAYRFESLASGFTAELAVDAQGLVLDYPGLFRRL
jgi:hypothetical protein